MAGIAAFDEIALCAHCPSSPMTAAVANQQSTDRIDDRPTSRLIVANHYEIDLNRPLGSGGMSIVYLGRDLKARRLVALRTLRPEYRRDPASRARFRQEARRMAFIQHPNVARVYDFREDDDSPWAVIEYVPGDSLKDIVDAQGPLEVDLISAYLTQIADALAQLHDRGLVHLDVKPQNLIVTTDGTIKLIDFGLAQPANNPQELIGGLAFGTAAYLSPEQASGERVSPASDVYSLGCVVYELLTGQPPFRGVHGDERPNEIIQMHLERTPVPPSRAAPDANIPGWVDELVLWSLEKRPADRFDDIRLFANLFAEGAEGALTTSTAQTMRNSITRPIDTHLASAPAYEEARSGEIASQPQRSRKGRTARSVARSRLPRLLSRVMLALLVANAILAGALYFQRGTIPGLYEGDRAFREGAGATVIVQDLNVRGEPGLAAVQFETLPFGAEVVITGPGVDADGETWWPVSYGAQASGYLWQGGLQPDIETGRDRVAGSLDDAIDWARTTIGAQ
jgi:serine/threonine protein kinase